MRSPDNCPTCDRRIYDYDDNGMEHESGQRWCRSHFKDVWSRMTDDCICGHSHLGFDPDGDTVILWDCPTCRYVCEGFASFSKIKAGIK